MAWFDFRHFLPGIVLGGLSVSVYAAQMEDYTGPLFPEDNAWRAAVNTLPIHPRSGAYIASLGESTSLHPDFGTSYEGHPIGIPYNIVGAGQTLAAMSFDYDTESDPGPYPIPRNPLIEGLNHWSDGSSGDRHILVVDVSSNRLYETWNTWPNPDDTAWQAGSGAVFDLTSNTLRPDTWTSADAAGLPIFPGLIRYDEVMAGEIRHAIRLTAQRTQQAYVWPARHGASSITDPNVPPLGQRFRLKANFNISGFTPRMQVILRALKTYGFILADNGSNWFFSGTHDDRWDDDELNSLKTLQGSNFEAVDISAWLNHPGFDPDSGAVPAGATSRNSDPPGSAAESVVFPNPAVRHNPTIRIFAGETDNLKVIITDASGMVVHTGRFSSTPNGTLHGRPYHDTTWTGRKASGVYFAVISGTQGRTAIRQRIKFGVVQ